MKWRSWELAWRKSKLKFKKKYQKIKVKVNKYASEYRSPRAGKLGKQRKRNTLPFSISPIFLFLFFKFIFVFFIYLWFHFLRRLPPEALWHFLMQEFHFNPLNYDYWESASPQLVPFLYIRLPHNDALIYSRQRTAVAHTINTVTPIH